MIQTQDEVRSAKRKSSKVQREFHLETNANGVFALGLCYIAAPCLIFLASFVRPLIGFPLAAALAWLLYTALRTRWNWSPALYGVAAIFAAALVMVVGIPKGHSAYDWVKHWALINEIADHTWPVCIKLHGIPSYLRFYLAAYLSPALIHKTIPLIPVSVLATVWFLLGYLLVFRVSAVPYERRSLGVAAVGMAVPMVLSGADAYLRHLPYTTMGQMHGWIGFHYGNRGSPLEFASGLSSLAFVPHQSIPIFIVTAMIVMDRGENSLARVILAYSLLALWSPYGMIGLLPVMLLRLAQARNQLISKQNLVAIGVGVTFTLLVVSYLSTELPQAGPCVTCIVQRADEILPVILFLLMELCAFQLLLGQNLFTDSFCAIAFATLVLIAFMHGETVDFVARGAIGPLFILGLRGTEFLLDFKAPRMRLLPVTLAALICLPTALSEIAFHYQKGAAYRTPDGKKLQEAEWLSIFSPNPNVNAEQFFDTCGWKFESQYFSHTRPKVLKP